MVESEALHNAKRQRYWSWPRCIVGWQSNSAMVTINTQEQTTYSILKTC